MVSIGPALMRGQITAAAEMTKLTGGSLRLRHGGGVTAPGGLGSGMVGGTECVVCCRCDGDNCPETGLAIAVAVRRCVFF